jgi:hypothetical protein
VMNQLILLPKNQKKGEIIIITSFLKRNVPIRDDFPYPSTLTNNKVKVGL